jgi:hypothetical protein
MAGALLFCVILTALLSNGPRERGPKGARIHEFLFGSSKKRVATLFWTAARLRAPKAAFADH